jgi:hypothetical protein
LTNFINTTKRFMIVYSRRYFISIRDKNII